jgi:hypothetical protein
MHSGHTIHPHAPAETAETIGAGLNAWRTLAIDLPLRLAAETMRFTGRRLQAQADHLAALARCGSLKDAVELQTTFATKGLSDYRMEATTLSQDVTRAAFPKAA